MEDLITAPANNGIKKRACLQCSAMKAKCIYLAGGNECERCHIQNRKCTPKVSGPRKKRVTVVTTIRVAQLEQRLDSLANLLASTQKTPSSNDEQSPNSGSWSRSSVPQISQDIGSPLSLQQSGLLHDVELREGLTSTLMRIDPSRALTAPALTSTVSSTHHASLSRAVQTFSLDPDDCESERLVDLFRTECNPYFPFIDISATKTARDLHRDSPFLWKVIVMITSSWTPSRQSALCANIMEEISTRLLLRGEKTLELLQGILLFTAWNHHLFTTNPQMSNLLQLLKSLLVNLGLDRAPNSVDRRKMFIEGNVGTNPPDSDTTLLSRTLEERRTFLGCLYLVSAKSVLCCSRPDTLPLTPYLFECLAVLSGSPQAPEDMLLVSLIHLQRIVDTIVTMFPKDDPYACGGPRAPIMMAVKALQGELHGFKRDLPGELAGNVLIEMNYHAASIYLYEIALFDSPLSLSTSDSYLSLNHGIEKLSRLSLISSCLASVKSFLQIYHSLPTSHYASFPFAIYGQSIVVLTTAIKLALFDFPGWDLSAVRRGLNLLNILDHEIRLVSAVSERRSGDSEAEKDIFQGFVRRLGKLRATYAAKVKAEEGALVEENFQMPTPMAMGELFGDGTSYFPEADDEFWRGLGADLGMMG